MIAKSFKKIIQSFIHFTVKHKWNHQHYDEVAKILLALDMSEIGFRLKTIPTDSESPGLQIM
jgi:hypothetical protein